MPFFRCLKRELFESERQNAQLVAEANSEYATTDKRKEDEISVLVNLTQQIYSVVERELKLTGFWESIPARNKLRAEIQQILLSPQFVNLPNVKKNRSQIISRILEIAETKNDTVLYSS
jgi:type I restriction enzyme R subunit